MPAAGMGASGPDRPTAPPRLPAADLPPGIGRGTTLSADTVATLLNQVSQADWTRLLAIVDPVRPPDGAAVDELLHGMRESVASQDVARALDLVRQLVTLSPERAETLSATPELAPIRPAIEQLLNQVTVAARLRAEGHLAEAAEKVEVNKVGYRGEIKPEILFSLAERLIAAGGLANYVRSEAVSSALLDPTRWIPTTLEQMIPSREPQNAWRVSLRLVVALWLSLGLLATALCWLLRVEYLATVALVWAAGGIVLLLVRVWRDRSS